jgi:hypothetical protein
MQRLLDAARVEALPEVIVSAAPFTEVFKRESCNADLVFLGFDAPVEGEEDVWFARYEALLSDGPTTVLVCSAGGEDILA